MNKIQRDTTAQKRTCEFVYEFSYGDNPVEVLNIILIGRRFTSDEL